MGRGKLAGGEEGHAAGPVDTEDLSPAVKDHAPGIAGPHEIVQQRVKLKTPGAEAVKTGLEEVPRPPGSLHP